MLGQVVGMCVLKHSLSLEYNYKMENMLYRASVLMRVHTCNYYSRNVHGW
jgi:hypothetical protein